MAITIAANGNYEQRVIEMGSATATSSDTETTIATIDARGFSIGSFTIKNAGAQTVLVNIYGYNDPSYSDESSVGTTINARQTSVATGLTTAVLMGVVGTGTNAVPSNLVFAYYKIKLINNTTGAGHASSTSVFWCLKNT